jgi:hypothetical protein
MASPGREAPGGRGVSRGASALKEWRGLSTGSLARPLVGDKAALVRGERVGCAKGGGVHRGPRASGSLGLGEKEYSESPPLRLFIVYYIVS